MTKAREITDKIVACRKERHMQGVPDEFCAKCILCGHLDTRQDDVKQWAEGWVLHGSHDVVQPQYAPRWAHSYCVENAVRDETS